MKSNKKLALIVSLAVMGFGFSVAGVQASAAGETSTTDSNYFNFENGAAVRLVDDGQGEAIRFQSVIGKDYYEALVAKYTNDETVTLKSKVSDADNESRYLTTEWVLIGENALDMTFTADNEANFYHAISFEELFQDANEDNIKEAVALDLKAEMYIEVDGGDEVQTIKAGNGVESVTRSARAIANEAYDAYANDTTKAARVAKYFGKRVEVTEDIYFEAGDTLAPVVAKGVADDFDFASAAVYAYKDTLEGELPAATDFSETLGTTAAVSFTLFDSNNNVLNVNAASAMYVTKALKTEADLKVFDLGLAANDDDDSTNDVTISKTNEVTTQVKGYYVLANDIENDPNVASNKHTGLTYTANGEAYKDPVKTAEYTGPGFMGTFDGQGYTLACDVNKAGIFGVLGTYAIIKDVKVQPTYDADNKLAACVLAYGLRTTGDNPNTNATWGVGILAEVSNVYVEIEDFRSDVKGNYTSGLIYTRASFINVHDCIVEIKNTAFDATTVTSGAFYAADDNRGNYSITYKNNYIVCKTPIWVSMDSNVKSVNRNIRIAAKNDVALGTVETTVNNVAGLLKSNIGSATAGTYVMKAGYYGDGNNSSSSVASTHDNTTNINYMSTVFRYDTYAKLSQAQTAVANWSVSETGITWNA